MLQIGETAPAFSLQDQDGELRELGNYQGQIVLLYFYPKDDTPGCTKEACAIAEVYDEFEKRGVKVLGVSTDDQASHKAFAEKYHLPFTLLSDPDGGMIEAYGAKKESGGTARISYLIDQSGAVLKTYPDVDPASHALQILKDLEVAG